MSAAIQLRRAPLAWTPLRLPSSMRVPGSTLPFGPSSTSTLLVIPLYAPVSASTHVPSDGHSCLIAYTPDPIERSSIGNDLRRPFTNPSAVADNFASAG